MIGVTALAIAFGADQRFTTAVPGYTEELQQRVERNSTARRELRELTDAPASTPNEALAPELRGISQWINSEPLTLRKLRGQVVLIDFWTYSCVNCLRTLPHLKEWDRAYRDDGLTIIGMHAPEFAFERVPDNVRTAVRKLGIRYPVALDNDFATWTAYANEYWPAKYLIDRQGRVRYYHYGEGEYDETERLIRQYLGEMVTGRAASVADRTPTGHATPESYLGWERLDRFVGSIVVPNQVASYRFPVAGLGTSELAYAGPHPGRARTPRRRPQCAPAAAVPRQRGEPRARGPGTGGGPPERAPPASDGGRRGAAALPSARAPGAQRGPTRAALHAGRERLRLHVRLSLRR